MATILTLGFDPRLVELPAVSGIDTELVLAYLNSEIQRIRAAGYHVDSCLIDDGETAEKVVRARLTQTSYDCVMFGAGLRAEQHLRLLEDLLNVVHVMAPNAKICFNSTPADSLQAVKRWVSLS